MGCSELTIRLLNTKLIFRLIVYFVALMRTHIMPTGTATKLGVFGASNHGVRTQFGWKTRVVLVGLNLIYLQFLWSKSCSWSIHVTYKKIYMVLEIRSKGLNLNHSWLKGFYHTLPGSLLSPTDSSGLGFCLISVFTNSPSHLRQFYRRLISCFVQMLFQYFNISIPTPTTTIIRQFLNQKAVVRILTSIFAYISDNSLFGSSLTLHFCSII